MTTILAERHLPALLSLLDTGFSFNSNHVAMRKHYLHLPGKGILTLLLSLMLSMPGLAQISQFIHVDQFGYAPAGEKVAVLSNPVVGYNATLSYTPPATM